MKRELNFEVMRTVAMFFIVVYHCLTHGVGEVMGMALVSAILQHYPILCSLISCWSLAVLR